MSNRIKKKFIDNNAVDGSKLRLLNSESVRAKKKDSDEDVSLFKLNAQDEMEFQVIPKLSQNPLSADDLVRKAYVDSKVSQEASDRAAAVSAEADARQAADLAEENARKAADLAEENARKAADLAEENARKGADEALNARLEVLELDPVTKTYVNQKVGSEASAREAADLTLESAINTEKGRIDAILSASVADKDSFKEIVDLINSVDLENDNALASAILSLQSKIDSEEANRKSAVTAEENARKGADEGLDTRLKVLELDPTTKSYVDGKVLTINNDMDSLDAYAQDIRGDLDQEILDRIADVNAEESARITGDVTLQSNLDAEEAARKAADTTLDNKITTKFNESKSYTDQKISDLVASAPAVLDTLKELSDALGGDANFATSVATQIANSSNSVGDKFKKEAFGVDAGMISAGYIDLSSKAFENSIVLTNGRLMMLSGEDYSVSPVSGKTRITFMGSMLPSGEEALEVGDKLRVSYLEDIR